MNGMAYESREPVREDEQGLQRTGCGGTVGSYVNYTGGISATLDASYYKGTGTRNGKEREFLAVTGAMNCMDEQQSIVKEGRPARKYVVRRLTPTECARLQGFPDWWCDGADGSDSAQYKMWGNGIALPCAADVLRRVAKALNEE